MTTRTYVVEIEGREWPVEVDETAEGLRVRVGDGPPQVADWSLAQAVGRYSLLLDNESCEVRVIPAPDARGEWLVSLGQQDLRALVQTERDRRLRRVGAGRQAAGGEIAVKAPMPGLVRAVAVAPGDSVEAGQRLLILEAMKMENDIPAPRAGMVKAVNVAAGDAVETGRPLVVLA